MKPLHPDFLRLPLAHRALHDKALGRPENSGPAIDAAIAAGYGIEIDVQMSSDGAAMVFHDYDLGRLTGRKGPVQGRSRDELEAMPLLGGGTIPTLDAVLSQVHGRVPLVIEIKDQDGGMGPDVGRLEQAVADAVRGYVGPLAVMSFNPHSVEAMARLVPDVTRGLVTSAYRSADWPLSDDTCDRLRGIPDADRIEIAFFSHEADDLARPRVAELADRGLAVLCWTIRSPEAEARARRHAHNITFEGYRPGIPA